MSRWIPGAAFVLAAWLAMGCSSTITLQVRQETPLPPERNAKLLAGVGRADITPRPGMPTTGYATNGNSGQGFRTRLYARVIYLKSVDNRPVALVQCDLLAGSELMHRKLAELVAAKTDLDMGGIMMSGTHTHSGPGNLLGSCLFKNWTVQEAAAQTLRASGKCYMEKRKYMTILAATLKNYNKNDMLY